MTPDGILTTAYELIEIAYDLTPEELTLEFCDLPGEEAILFLTLEPECWTVLELELG